MPRAYLQLKSEELQVVRYIPGEQFKVTLQYVLRSSSLVSMNTVSIDHS